MDAEEKMTALTDDIHSLFRGYVNGFNVHKDAHLRLEKQLAERDKTIEKLLECVGFYAEKMNRHNGVAKQCLKEIESQSSAKTEGE